MRTVNLFFLILLLIFSSFYNGFAESGNNNGFNSGLRIIEFPYKNNGRDETIACAVWYPTKDTAKNFVYHTRKDVESKIAPEALLASENKPYPLVIFCHGAYSSGYASAYFTEYLAKQGYIVIAPDFNDNIPPSYTKQIAFDRIKQGNTGRPIEVLKAAKGLVEDMNADRERCFSILRGRFDEMSFVIDKMLELNKDSNSIFYNSIDTDKIAAVGHSLGGAALLGKIGGHPDFKDSRIKAALLFSPPAYPYENTISGIYIPTMLMVGDNDGPGLGGPDIPRGLIYDKGNTPKFYMVFKDATHFLFSNGGCEGIPFYEAVQDNPKIRSICEYGSAFFDKYLKGDVSASKRLNKVDGALVYYVKEEQKGEAFEYGKEPPPGTDVAGGIREEIKKGRQEGKGNKGPLRRGFLKRLLQNRQGAY